MRSNATTVDQYLAELPEERRTAIQATRAVILENLPEGYEEAMNWGMIVYQVPLERYPDTYNRQPLMYAALASQKNYMSLFRLLCAGDGQPHLMSHDRNGHLKLGPGAGDHGPDLDR